MATKDQFSKSTPCVLAPQASREELVEYLNRNITGDGTHPGLRSWSSKAVVHVKGFPAGATATIAVAGPRNLRMRVSTPLMPSPLMDMGSNNERFWLWAKDDPHKAIMTCAHEDVPLALSEMQMRLPFQPDWLMEVLGVIPLDPNEFRVERPSPDGPMINLVATRIDPTGEDVERVIQVNACHGIIIDHELRRKSDRHTIARASLTGHYRDPDTQIVLPKQIRIDWVDVDLYVVLDFTKITVNPELPDESSMWTMPSMPGCEVVDIGKIARERGRQQVNGQRTESERTASTQAATVEGFSSVEELGSQAEQDAGGEQGADAPAWAAPPVWSTPEDVEATSTSLGNQPPTTDEETIEPQAGRIRMNEYESPAETDDANAARPFPEAEESIRMQSQETSRQGTIPPRRWNLFSWLWGRSARPAAAPPSTYSREPSRSSWGRPRLGQE
jgi:hypothetical protein